METIIERDGYVKTITISGIGIVKKVIIKNVEIQSTAFFTNNTKNFIGLEITILDEDIEKESILFLPQIEIKAIDVLKMEGLKVKYKYTKWSTTMEGTSTDSKIKILDGELAGQVFEGQTFV